MADFLKNKINATHLFISGLLIIPAFLFQSGLLLKFIQVCFFAVLGMLAGKRIKIFYFIVLILMVTFFESLLPSGRILLILGPIRITSLALERGLVKGLALTGLVFISLSTVRPDLYLPGHLGGLLVKMFYYFEEVFAARKKIRAKDFMGSLDSLLFSIYTPGVSPPAPLAKPVQTSRTGWLFLFGMLLLNWGAWFMGSGLT